MIYMYMYVYTYTYTDICVCALYLYVFLAYGLCYAILEALYFGHGEMASVYSGLLGLPVIFHAFDWCDASKQLKG